MTEKTCYNCAHWREFNYGPEKGRGSCNLIPAKKGRLLGPDEGPKAMACEGTGEPKALAWLETAPDFGCTLFEPGDGDHSPRVG